MLGPRKGRQKRRPDKIAKWLNPDDSSLESLYRPVETHFDIKNVNLTNHQINMIGEWILLVNEKKEEWVELDQAV